MKMSVRAIFLSLFPAICSAQSATSNFPPLPPVDGTIAGTIGGEFDVDPSGAATYKIPLSVPPGTAQMAPKLSLNYNSAHGDGLLGTGWTLNGISVIARCPTTLARDGYAQVANFDQNDRFCLDGMRLIASQGTYGANGTTYTTTPETFAKVQSFGASGIGPQYFIVYRKDGLILEYGRTADSRLAPLGRVDIISWQLSKISDRNGNYLEILYSKDVSSGEIVPFRMNYTGNSQTGLAPYNSVRFEYEARTFPMITYAGGSMISSKNRLKKISMYTDENLAWSYNLSYSNDTVTYLDRLTSLQECEKSGACLTTAFNWGAAPPDAMDYKPAYTYSDFGSQWGTLTTNPVLTGDWNGDGRTDIARVSSAYRSTPSMVSFAVAADTEFAPLPNKLKLELLPVLVGDWNGDGSTEVAKVRDCSIDFGSNVILSVPKAGTTCRLTTGTDALLTGDWDGDGRTDLLIGPLVYLSRSTSFLAGPQFRYSGTPVTTGDWNGDGLTDFATLRDYDINFYLSTGSSFTYAYSYHDTSLLSSVADTNLYPVLTGDWNGDGLTDFARVGLNGLLLCDSTGTGYANCRTLADFSPAQGYDRRSGAAETSPFVVSDFNGDGISDIARITSLGIRQYIVKGASFIGPFDKAEFGSAMGYPNNTNYPLLSGDWNGDGSPDLGRVTRTGVQFINRVSSQTNLLTGIIDNIGAKTVIEYTSLSSTSPQIYTKGSGAIYPNVDVINGGKVVSSFSFSNGLGSTSTRRYTYKGLRYNFQSRSSLGFAEVSSIDIQRGITTTTFYAQDGDFASLPVASEQRTSSGALLSRKEDTWASTATANNGRFSYVSQTILKNYELSGTLIKSSTTNYTYDSYGNITNAVVNNSDGSRETTSTTYNNDLANWMIGQILTTKVSKLPAGSGAIETSRNSRFTYLGTGLIQTETIEPGSPTLELKKTYTYDSYGNILSTTVSGPAIEPRTGSSRYDSRGQFPIKTINALGQSSSAEYDVRHGKPTRIQDPNGLVVISQWDGFGRLTYSSDATGVPSRIVYFKANGDPLSNAAYYVRKDTAGQLPSIIYYDEQNREIRREATGFNSKKILVDHVYDEKGQLSLVSNPYFEGESPLWTANEYDILGRPVRITSPGNRVTTIAYDGLTTTTTNPLGQTTKQKTDAQGHVLSAVDAAGNSLTYRYDGFGNLLEMKDPAGNTTAINYDISGNKIRLSDPDSGVTVYDVNCLGQIKTQTNSKGETRYNTYDLLGRIIQSRTPDAQSDWTYDTSPRGIGKLAAVSSSNGYKARYSYDTLGRVAKVERVVGGEIFSLDFSYDQYNRVLTLSYPDSFTVQNSYSDGGELLQITNASDGLTLWKADTKNASGQITAQTFGNGLQTLTAFDPNTNLVQSIKTGIVQDLSYNFDALGNLTKRQDLRANLSESFSYDTLNRLTKSQVNGAAPVVMTYDKLGNILSRTDAGTYLYGGAGPHAVTSINGPQQNIYTYDAAGNRVTSNGGYINYNSSGQPILVHQGNSDIQFILDESGQRVEEDSYSGGILSEKKILIDSLYQKITSGNTVKQVHYIMGPEGAVAQHITSSSSPAKTLYLHKDHLGSIQTITDERGNQVEVLSFDSWGVRRNPTTWGPLSNAFNSLTDRGFTGHEQLDSVGLIHMNGRIYDPAIGRFISPDPFVSSPTNLQSLNRYSYVNNNPLSFTDPSGFFLKGLFRFLKQIIPAVVAITVAYFQPLSVVIGNTLIATAANAVLASTAASVTGAVVNGSSIGDGLKAGIRAAPMSAVRALVAYGIGDEFFAGSEIKPEGSLHKLFGDYADEARIAAHGLTSGAITTVSGGKFIEGFASAAASAAGTAYLGDLKIYGAALTGGTAAALTGGKFAQGAVSGALVYLYNYEEHEGKRSYKDPRISNAERIFYGDDRGDKDVAPSLPPGWYKLSDNMARYKLVLDIAGLGAGIASVGCIFAEPCGIAASSLLGVSAGFKLGGGLVQSTGGNASFGVIKDYLLDRGVEEIPGKTFKVIGKSFLIVPDAYEIYEEKENLEDR